VPIVLAVVLLVALGTVLAHSESRLTGTNSVPLRGQGVGLRPGDELCQPNQLLPKGSGRLRMFASPDTPGQSPETLVIIRQKDDGVIARVPGVLRRAGALDVTIDPPVRRTRGDGEVCLRNTGGGVLVTSGILTPFGNAELNGKRLDLALTMLWYTSEKKSWLSELGAIVPRVGHARVGGVWAFWVASLFLLAAIGTALVAVIRESTR
jgi:hypothetical protein